MLGVLMLFCFRQSVRQTLNLDSRRAPCWYRQQLWSVVMSLSRGLGKSVEPAHNQLLPLHGHGSH